MLSVVVCAGQHRFTEAATLIERALALREQLNGYGHARILDIAKLERPGSW